ncbi:MAG: hypothetical protein JWM28_4237 [Chitinophagaceae bacterium]|nr:hypothetical protein [Chitinophagaceae bacterium]
MKKIIYFLKVFVSVIFLVSVAGCAGKKERKSVSSLPEENRFRKTLITDNLVSPVQLKVAGTGKVYLVETSGNLKIIDPITKQVKSAGTIKTYDGMEFGLLGFALDPDFIRNGWIYFQYGLPDKRKDSCIFQVSRFTIQSDSLLNDSEKRLVKIPYVYNCCHTAGGMSFDSKGNLYFSTGDNTDAFQTVYSPSDERPGHEIANALRSAANSMDLRGKILRIHPERDGSYSIPRGNLFEDGKKGRPEIYIMGCRNAYRIFADVKTDILYWGEVGPDADKDSTRGPKGYDEFNIANAAGYYGWPLFIGDNKPYKKIDFETATTGETFNPEKPVNYSRLNTGLAELPPSHKASIWYPYVESPDFAGFGTGGRTAIGGPVYHYDKTLESAIKLPAHFDKCWFIADWMRNWLKAVHLVDDTKVGKIDSLMPAAFFAKPIDMAFGIDGALYLIEYGSNWGANTDSKLVRIEYISGNRPPVAAIHADSLTGGTPLTVNFSARQSMDPDQDELKYQWQLSGKLISEKQDFSYTFSEPGKYDISLTVTDVAGEKNGTSLGIYAGNAKPFIDITLPNKSFYWDKVPYAIQVSDKEDGELNNGIAPASVTARIFKMPHNSFLTDHGNLIQKGELLISSSDCKSCHSNNLESVGPSFEKIAGKYAITENNISRLVMKILKGGQGIWGERSMAPHPQLRAEQTEEMVKYILSLARPVDSSSLSLNGTLDFSRKGKALAEPVYLIRSSYTDKGGHNAGQLTSSTQYLLRYPKLYPEDFDDIYESGVRGKVLYGRHDSFARLKDIDLTGIQQAIINAGGKGRIELHLDTPDGTIIGIGEMNDAPGKKDMTITMKETNGIHHLYLVRKSEKARFDENSLSWIYFSN